MYEVFYYGIGTYCLPYWDVLLVPFRPIQTNSPNTTSLQLYIIHTIATYIRHNITLSILYLVVYLLKTTFY